MYCNIEQCTADFELMVHQQQGWQWQFEKSLKPRSETGNGTSMQNALQLSPNAQQGGGPLPNVANNSTPAAMDSSQQSPAPRSLSTTPNQTSTITIP